MKTTLLKSIVITTIVWIAAAGSAAAQANSTFDQYMALLRKDLKSEKKQLFAMNLSLTDAEATKFWPIYDAYAAELTRLYDARLALIKEYAANYSANTVSNAAAASLTKRSIDNDSAIVRLRQRYVPLVGKVLPGKKAAFFFQLDKRIGLLVDLQLASEIPFVSQ